jgi:NAD-dependent deacetylase
VSGELTAGRDLLARAARVVVFTGAGVSAESGLPTFRGAGGLWKTFRAEELATPRAFARDPRLVWEWYGWRRGIVAGCRPNLAHVALGRWMLLRDGVTLVTQNVDDLHERGAQEAALALVREGRLPSGGGRAAVASDGASELNARDAAAPAAADAAGRAAPIRLHGSICHSRCTRCATRTPFAGPVDATTEATLPRCARCDGLLRPDVVWFGESLPEDALRAAFAAAAAAEVCLVVGTTGAVYPAAAVVHETRSAGGKIIVVDPGETEYDDVADVRLWGTAGEIAPVLLAER